MSDFSAFIFHVNRDDLLAKALNSIIDLRGYISIVDNSEYGCSLTLPNDVKMLTPSVPLSASQSFNFAMKLSRSSGNQFIIVMHEDAEAAPGVAVELVRIAREALSRGKRWSMIYSNYDCFAAMNLSLLDDVGLWDTNLPQYYTDNDFYYRARLAGYETINSNLQVFHHGSQTINSDPQRKFINGITFPLYGSYYASKWGGHPGEETFLTPFNR